MMSSGVPEVRVEGEATVAPSPTSAAAASRSGSKLCRTCSEAHDARREHAQGDAEHHEAEEVVGEGERARLGAGEPNA